MRHSLVRGASAKSPSVGASATFWQAAPSKAWKPDVLLSNNRCSKLMPIVSCELLQFIDHVLRRAARQSYARNRRRPPLLPWWGSLPSAVDKTEIELDKRRHAIITRYRRLAGIGIEMTAQGVARKRIRFDGRCRARGANSHRYDERRRERGGVQFQGARHIPNEQKGGGVVEKRNKNEPAEYDLFLGRIILCSYSRRAYKNDESEGCVAGKRNQRLVVR